MADVWWGFISRLSLAYEADRALKADSTSVHFLYGLSRWGGRVGELDGQFSRYPPQVFSAWGHCEHFWHGQGCPLFNVLYPAFPLPTTASPPPPPPNLTSLPRCPDGWFWGDCRGAWLAWAIRVFFSWQSPVVPQGSRSFSAPSRWSCSPSRRCREVSSFTWSRKPGSSSQGQQAGSMSHSQREFRRREASTTWIYLRSSWSCFACCLMRPSLLLPSPDGDFCWASVIFANRCSIGHLL